MNTKSGTEESVGRVRPARVSRLPMLSAVRAFASEPAEKKTTVLQFMYYIKQGKYPF